MLPPFPEKLPPKAEPGKPLYTRKPPQRQRPVLDKREQEGERKLHPTRQRPGAGRSAAAAALPLSGILRMSMGNAAASCSQRSCRRTATIRNLEVFDSEGNRSAANEVGVCA